MNVGLSIIWYPEVVVAGSEFTVRVAVENRGLEPLDSAGPHPLHLSYQWNSSAEREPLRTVLWQSIEPAATKLFDVRVAASLEPEDQLALTLVREHVRWFDRGEDAIVATCRIRTVPRGTLVPLNFKQYERKLRSQNGEDGIIAELLLRVGWQTRVCVEFGVSDGHECNSAHLVEEYNWGGCFIEADPALYARLHERLGRRSNVTLVNALITRENVCATFRGAGVPIEFDLLSIDVDGNDFWIWEALAQYRPRVVVIEYNAAYPPPRRWVMEYDPAHSWRGDTHHGASLASLAVLGARLGYALVGTESRGVNAFFVRDDLAAAANLVARDPAEVYSPPAFVHPLAAGPFVER